MELNELNGSNELNGPNELNELNKLNNLNESNELNKSNDLNESNDDLPFDIRMLYPNLVPTDIGLENLVREEDIPGEACRIIEWADEQGNHRYRFLK